MQLPQPKQLFKPVVLIIMDGVGIAPTNPGNAVTKAPTPFLEQAWDSYPHTILEASGEPVGLPPGIKGNSEVGHMNLGTGRVVYQDLPRINKAVVQGTFFRNPAFIEAFDHVHEKKSRIHAAVCFSDAGVHGTINHLEALIEAMKNYNVKQPLIVHAFTDGRDTPPKSAATFLTIIDKVMVRKGIGTFGSIMGRYYAMDRNQIWDRVEKAYAALTNGTGYEAGSWREAIDSAYARGETDEFISPTLIKSAKLQHPTVNENDAFIFLNYRADRAIELTSAFTLKPFQYFKRNTYHSNLLFIGMTQYAKGIPQRVAFPEEKPSITLGRLLSEHDQRQLRIAESEKFPHVTYFFNGGQAVKYRSEDRIEIPSPNVATYDLKPEMSLPQVTQTLLNKLTLRIYDFILVNLANGDMVGHTGVLEAGKAAMTSVDQAVAQIATANRSLGGSTLITADHGNVEEMINLKTNGVDTEHSMNPVPFIFIPPQRVNRQYKLESGSLADVTPTILSLMNLDIPSEMKGKKLLH